MLALLRILGFRRLAALWLIRWGWRLYTGRRSRARSGR
jgi:hypothetical protein